MHVEQEVKQLLTKTLALLCIVYRDIGKYLVQPGELNDNNVYTHEMLERARHILKYKSTIEQIIANTETLDKRFPSILEENIQTYWNCKKHRTILEAELEISKVQLESS
jgi:hypothetical protein